MDESKRKQYIRVLKIAANHADDGMITVSVDEVREIVELLREQEVRVLEYSEIEKHPLVWLQDNGKEDVIPALFLQYNGWNAEFAVQAPNECVDTIIRSSIVIAVEGMYGIMWRAWTSRPSEQQMRETKWEDKDAE